MPFCFDRLLAYGNSFNICELPGIVKADSEKKARLIRCGADEAGLAFSLVFYFTVW